MLPDRKKASIALLLMCISVFALLIPVIAEETEQKRESVTAEATKNISESNSEPLTRLIPAGITRLNEITVTAKRHEEKIFDVPYAAHVITSDDILMQKSIKTLPEALREETSIMIQKTSHGQGSPYIRGFTSFHNLKVQRTRRKENRRGVVYSFSDYFSPLMLNLCFKSLFCRTKKDVWRSESMIIPTIFREELLLIIRYPTYTYSQRPLMSRYVLFVVDRYLLTI